jgi:transcriptional regulator with XRE-family HTH domain
MSEEVYPATIGGRVRFARERRRIGVNELDELLGTRSGYVSRLENGHFEEVGSEKLGRIGEVLKVDLNWLIRGLGSPELAAA